MVEFADLEAKTEGAQEITLAVLGAPTVGKSTFVQCALDLRKGSTSPVSCKKVSLEGELSVVRLFELSFEDLEITANQDLRWPIKIGEYDMPTIDGVFALYDVQDQGSIACIPALLSESLGCQQALPLNETMRRLKPSPRFHI